MKCIYTLLLLLKIKLKWVRFSLLNINIFDYRYFSLNTEKSTEFHINIRLLFFQFSPFEWGHPTDLVTLSEKFPFDSRHHSPLLLILVSCQGQDQCKQCRILVAHPRKFSWWFPHLKNIVQLYIMREYCILCEFILSTYCLHCLVWIKNI
jgi:hypothetical protein